MAQGNGDNTLNENLTGLGSFRPAEFQCLETLKGTVAFGDGLGHPRAIRAIAGFHEDSLRRKCRVDNEVGAATTATLRNS